MGIRRNCVICHRSLSAREIEEGLVVQSEKGLICVDCVPRMNGELESAASPPPQPKEARVVEGQPSSPGSRDVKNPNIPRGNESDASPEASNREMAAKHRATPNDAVMAARLDTILQEVHTISQFLLFERSSIWNVLGGVVQVFVFGVLAAAALWRGHTQELLLIALLLQVMVLTFFVKGR